MKKKDSLYVTLSFSGAEEDYETLAKGLARIHSEMVWLQLQKTEGAPEEKRKLLEAMLSTLSNPRDIDI